MTLETEADGKLRNYALVTAGYWTFTLTDGALRMLVLLHFHRLGYSPVSIAFLFLAYELMGVITNLVGGWVGSRTGLHRTLLAGLSLQIVALLTLTLQQADWPVVTSVIFVMATQALSGVAKDLTKMSSKSAVKLVAGDGHGTLFRLVALLTGSKNALKGVGFFIGAALLGWVGYNPALRIMAGGLCIVAVAVAVMLTDDLGRSKAKEPLRSLLSKSPAINRLSAARFFLFGSRDIWFVVALPIFLSERLGWSFEGTGAFLAAWVIGYGMVQSVAPKLVGQSSGKKGSNTEGSPEVVAAQSWIFVLCLITAALAVVVSIDVAVTAAVVGGLMVFGFLFAVNSSLHSFLILAYADDETVALDVGFYYSANAGGRLVGTLLSGVLYLRGGLAAALWGSAAFLLCGFLLTRRLPLIGPQPDAAKAGS